MIKCNYKQIKIQPLIPDFTEFNKIIEKIRLEIEKSTGLSAIL